MEEKLRNGLIKAIDEHQWISPVDSGSFETYKFEAEPCGVFPRYPILGITGSVADEPMRMLNQEYKPNSEVKPDGRED